MKLYKYRKFSEYLLSELFNDKLFFSNPNHFNDPFDCNPALNNDLPLSVLKEVCFTFESRLKDEKLATELITKLEYFSSVEDKKDKYDELLKSQLLQKLQSQLDLDLKSGRGVLALSDRNNSSLMWSHYASDHKGVCLEFEVPPAKNNVKKVNYKGPRTIKTSDIKKYLSGDLSVKNFIYDTYFFTKDSDWSYENEWRIISPKVGEQYLNARLTGIYFGIKCPSSIITTVTSLMSKSFPELTYYKMHASSSSFNLNANEIQPERWEKPCMSPLGVFDDVT